MIRFAEPHILYLLAAAPALMLYLYWRGKRKRKLLEDFAQPDLLGELTATASVGKKRWKNALIVVAIVFLVIAAARPQFGTRMELVKRKGINIVIAVDVSKSMLAEDIKPSRLSHTKHEVRELLKILEDDNVGLVAFAGDAFVQCPLTQDYGAVELFLDIMDAELIPTPGTAIAKAIKKSISMFDKKEKKYKAIILFTDGEDHEGAQMEAAKEAEKMGVRIYTVGLGRAKGEPIPTYDSKGNKTGYMKDTEGNVVMSRLDETTLEKIALITGGKYYPATTREFELNEIYRDISKMEEKTLKTKRYASYEERYQFPLGLGLLLLIIEALISDRATVRRKEVHLT